MSHDTLYPQLREHLHYSNGTPVKASDFAATIAYTFAAFVAMTVVRVRPRPAAIAS